MAFNLNKEKVNQSKIFQAITSIATFSIIWLLIIFILSLLELIYNKSVHHLSQNFIHVLLLTWLNDLFFWFRTLLFIYPVFTLIYLISPKTTVICYYIFIVMMVFFQFSLGLYFTKALVPLGADAYRYSSAEIKQTIGASGVISILNVVLLIFLSSLTIFSLWFLSQKLKFNRFIIIGLPFLALLIFSFSASALVSAPTWKSEFTNNLILNKSDYLWESSYKHFYPTPAELDIYSDDYITSYGKSNTNEFTSFKYSDPKEYPFLHSDTTADVLSPFFKSYKKLPNIVIILVEGLGRAFTNEGAYLGNFTPFIDSLSGKGLYWKNFLSEGGRTFAVLPSVLGSLPFAKNGFLELGGGMPNHLSLLSLLKYNGYHTSFYYGGDAHFDNMDVFLHKNNIDELNDEKSFSSGHVRLPAPNGFSWGYNDKSLFRHFLTSRDEKESAPQLSVVLTVSTHSPFAINEESKYIEQFEQRMDGLNFTEVQKNEHRLYKLQYASILYLDDALREFFNNYRKRIDYSNTIFLITGDHRMPEIPMSDKIDRYHVPLIIYSPVLKRTAQIASVSTHFDISPTLLAYLHHNYKIKGPSLVSWMGQGLDTNQSFRNVHSYPLMQTKTDIIDFVMGEYHLNEETLFKLNADLGEDPIHDDEKFSRLSKTFEQFKVRNSSIQSGSHIIPDSIYRHYNKIK